MDPLHYILYILAIILIAAVLIAGELHLKMDKYRATAELCLKKLTDPFADWISCAEKITTLELSDTQLQGKLVSAIEAYRSLTKKQLFERPNALNEIHRLVKLIVSKEPDNPVVTKTGNELTQLFVLFVDLVDKYNLSVYKLDKQLNKTFSGIVGKISRFKKLDSIVNLTVL